MHASHNAGRRRLRYRGELPSFFAYHTVAGQGDFNLYKIVQVPSGPGASRGLCRRVCGLDGRPLRDDPHSCVKVTLRKEPTISTLQQRVTAQLHCPVFQSIESL